MSSLEIAKSRRDYWIVATVALAILALSEHATARSFPVERLLIGGAWIYVTIWYVKALRK